MKQRKGLLCCLLALLLAVCLVGCSRSAEAVKSYAPAETSAGEYPYDPASDDVLYEMERYSSPAAPGSSPSSDGSAVFDGQKLIRRVRLTVETEDYTAFMNGLNAKIGELGGYTEQVDANTSGSEPCAEMTIRIPADRLDSLVAHISGVSNVTRRFESQENVTLQYVDTESRVNALRVEQERLLALLEKAESLEQILQIEDRLGEVRYELESAASSLRALANKVDYATVNLSVRQVQTYTPTQEEGFWSRIGTGFVASANGVWQFLKNLFRLFIVSIPYLLLLGCVALIVVLCIRLPRRARKKRLAASESAVPQTPAPEEPAEPQQES